VVIRDRLQIGRLLWRLWELVRQIRATPLRRRRARAKVPGPIVGNIISRRCLPDAL